MPMSSIRSLRSTTFALLVPVAVLSACKGDKVDETATVQTTTADGRLSSPSGERNASMVRMINALPNMSQATVMVDDRALFSSVDYKAVTAYNEIDETFARFRIQGAGRDTTIASNNEILIDGSRYTLVALPEGDGEVRLRVLKDEIVPDSGKARIRVIHGVIGADEIDIMLQGDTDPMFDNVNLTSEAGYRDVDPKNTTLLVRTDGNGKQILRKEMRLQAGHSYTVVLSGTVGKRVEAIVIDDRAVSSQTPAQAADSAIRKD